MPSHEQVVSLNDHDKETNLAILYAAMQQLQWTILYAGEDFIIGNTHSNWKRRGQKVTARIDEDYLTILSEMTHGEMGDMLGLNKKNTTHLADAFKAAKASVTTDEIDRSKEAIDNLRIETIKIAEQQQREAEELNRAMNLSGSNLYATYTIIALNVLVFLLMAFNGAGIIEPDGLVHIQWGSNYKPLTLSGDWWRLFTNTFIHFGIIHLAMNMYCLYMIGIYLEPMLGKTKYVTAYICTGILASLVSLWWHKETANSAGASGAIFGMYGLFLALLTTSLIPKAARQPLLQSIGIFIAYNLFFGMKGGIDNSAHIGGLISGFGIGYIYAHSIKKEKQEQQKLQWIIPVVIVLTIIPAYEYLQKHKVSKDERTAALNELKEAAYKDADKFNEQLTAFDKINASVNDIVANDSLTDETLIKKIDQEGLPQWEQAERLIEQTANYDISPQAHAKAEKILQYIALRKKEFQLIRQITSTQANEGLRLQLDSIRIEAGKVFEQAANQ